MRFSLKVAAVLIVAILIVSSVYIGFFSNSRCGEIPATVIDKGESNTGSGNGGDEPNNGGEYTHTVFVEEGTATWCENCPIVASILHEIYNEGKYNFYYVSMVQDKNSKASTRLYTDYNIYGFPTVYIDGGYKVIVGADNEKSVYENAISSAQSREAPKIKVSLNAEFDNDTNEIVMNVLVENNEDAPYSGHLKVYLSEIISRWVNINSYHFGFIDYALEKDISVDGKTNTTIAERKSLTDLAVADLVPEELMLVAVMFSSSPVEKYSDPETNGYAFDAYYADATNATTLVQGGNLPPTIGISLPEVGKLHLFGKPVFENLYKKVSSLLKVLLNRTVTILVGKTTVVATTEDDTGIEKVEFYIDDQLKFTDTQAPYEYTFSKVKLLKRFMRQHTITVTAYDTQGKSATTSLDVLAFFL